MLITMMMFDGRVAVKHTHTHENKNDDDDNNNNIHITNHRRITKYKNKIKMVYQQCVWK